MSIFSKEMPLVTHIYMSQDFHFTYFLFGISFVLVNQGNNIGLVPRKLVFTTWFSQLSDKKESDEEQRFEPHNATKICTNL